MQTKINSAYAKKLLELYRSGKGISNKELKKIAPNAYSGDKP